MTDVVRKHITLPRELAEEFEELVGERNQSSEIAAMIEQRLQSERVHRAFEDLAATPKGDYPEWDGPGAISRWVEKQRAAWDRDLDLDEL